MSTEGKTAYIAVTQRGTLLAQNLRRLMGKGEIYTTGKVKGLLKEQSLEEAQEEAQKKGSLPVKNEAGSKIELSPQEEGRKASLSLRSAYQNIREIRGTLGTFTRELFEEYDYLVFIMAAGIVVRVIAPYVDSKFKDPAVIVLDEGGIHAISLLSGHMGGANEMTVKISSLLGADPVITTATDINQKAALDCIIKELDAYVENMREAVKTINYELASGEEAGLYIDGDYKVDERGFIRLDKVFNLADRQSKEAFKMRVNCLKHIVYISHKSQTELEALVPTEKLIKVVPGRFVLGVGCKKNTPAEHMQQKFNEFTKVHGIDPHSIRKIGSITIKQDEAAIKALSSRLKVPFEVFDREALSQVEHLFEGSDFVKKTIGVSCVAEPAAYLLGNGRMVVSKEKYEGITFALGEV